MFIVDNFNERCNSSNTLRQRIELPGIASYCTHNGNAIRMMVHHFTTPPTTKNTAHSALGVRQREQIVLARQTPLALASHFLLAMYAQLQ